MDQAVIALIIMAVMLVLFVLQIFPLPVTAMLAAFAMAFFGLTDLNTILAQFGTSNVFCVLGMMIVGGALFETGFARKLGNMILGKRQDNEKLFLIILLITVTIFSAFLSNTTTTAMFMPVVAGIAANSGGRISKKDTFMAIGFGATLGGCMTLMGSPTQHLLAQSLLEENGFSLMGFFYGVRGTLLMLAIMILYFLFIGGKVQKKVLTFPEVADTVVKKTEGEEKHSTYKMVMSGVILVATITLIATKVFSSGGGALVGAVVCVATGCIDIESAFKKVSWSVVTLLGALFSVSAAFNASGAGELCVNTIFSLFGENVNPFLIYAVLCFVAMILTNIIDNIAAQALIGPIAIAIAVRTGINPMTMVFSILASCNIAYMTPISTPCVTMTLAAGYRFTDYLKIGGLLSMIEYLAMIVLFPLVYGF